ncbi:hypothetical protein BZG36_00625 [Bifiguratus adelaidae]|uniref:L-2-hydroxyglutarate dehydrogenase, mitochondrial n=1 Tax=Bifiguratus adelaidae TaxID=1938954 RepID=A0A261Y7L7_9FUNG|nr:hypothetical protein BZG36_00625 [Bifiguratus adelaidae]
MTSSTVVRLARSPAPVTLSCRMNKITTARSLLCNRSLHTTARVLLASPIQVPPAAAKSANKTTADNPAGIHLWDRLPGEGGKPRRGMAKIRGPLRESRFRLVTDGNKPEVNPRKVNEFDVAIVGGGIIGMATAREILKRFPKMTLAVLEKEREVAAHQTGHNSGVIHAGMYYVPGTTMAYTCVRGNALMYEYCEQHDLPVERCGKLIVATSKDEHPTVEMLYNQGVKNGVQGLEILDSKGIQEKEPNVRGYSALYSPNTGICDYQMVTECMAREVTASGRAEIKLACEALDFKETEDGRVAVTVVEPGQKGPKFDVTARNVITCAGFYADRLAAKAGGDKSLARISTFRGQYYQIKQASTIRGKEGHCPV